MDGGDWRTRRNFPPWSPIQSRTAWDAGGDPSPPEPTGVSFGPGDSRGIESEQAFGVGVVSRLARLVNPEPNRTSNQGEATKRVASSDQGGEQIGDGAIG